MADVCKTCNKVSRTCRRIKQQWKSMKRFFKNSSERRQSQEETRKVSANVVVYVADVSKTCNKESLTWRAWDKQGRAIEQP